jgi:AsmA protein
MKSVVKIVAIIVAVLVVIAVALPFVIDVNRFKPEIEQQLTATLGRQVNVGNMSLSILGGSVSAADLSIADDPAFSKQPFVQAKGLDVGVELMPLIFSKTLNVTNLTIDHPQVSLLKDAKGRWNFSSLGAKAGAADPPAATAPAAAPAKKTTIKPNVPAANPELSVGKLEIKDGSVTMATIGGRAKPQVFPNLNITVQNFSFTSNFPFTLSAELPGGSDVKLDGTAGPIPAADASLTPVQATIAVSKLDLAASGFVDPASGIAGITNFNGTVSSDGHQAKSNGTASIDNLKVSPKGSPAGRTVDVNFSTVYELEKQSGDLTQGDITIGKALAKLTGTYQMQPETTVLNMKLALANMPVNDLEAMLPALGVTLPSGSSLQGGTVTANFTIVGPVDKLVINGPVQLANTTLKGFNLGAQMSAISALSGAKTGSDTVIQNFSTDAHVAPEGISTQNVNLNIPSLGDVTGSGTISPQNELNYHMNAKVGGGAAGGIASLMGGGKNSAGIPFFIQGTTANPKFMPDVKGMLSSQFGGKQGQGNLVNGITGLLGGKKN